MIVTMLEDVGGTGGGKEMVIVTLLVDFKSTGGDSFCSEC